MNARVSNPGYRDPWPWLLVSGPSVVVIEDDAGTWRLEGTSSCPPPARRRWEAARLS